MFGCQLCSTRYTVKGTAFQIKNFPEAALQSTHMKEMVPHPDFINYRLKSEVSIMLRCRLCSTRYTAIRIKNRPNSNYEKYG